MIRRIICPTTTGKNISQATDIHDPQKRIMEGSQIGMAQKASEEFRLACLIARKKAIATASAVSLTT